VWDFYRRLAAEGWKLDTTSYTTMFRLKTKGAKTAADLQRVLRETCQKLSESLPGPGRTRRGSVPGARAPGAGGPAGGRRARGDPTPRRRAAPRAQAPRPPARPAAPRARARRRQGLPVDGGRGGLPPVGPRGPPGVVS